MKLICKISVIMMLMICVSQVQAVTLSFDDIPEGSDLNYYGMRYGIGFSRAFDVADHTGSAWGPPHSGSNVLICPQTTGYHDLMFKDGSGPFYANSIGAHFSTESGVVIEMIGYHHSLYQAPVASILIGAAGESWDNEYVQISSTKGIGIVVFRPVTTDALLHFCADDMNMEFVPEPSSFLVLGTGLVPLLLRRQKR